VLDPFRNSDISYAFDVEFPLTSDPTAAGPQFSNRRVFAFTDSGAPDGIKLDAQGNVFAGW
jgi:sugar lactone lactonase YvrE